MGINTLTIRKLANQRRSKQIQEVMSRTITKPVRWVLCLGKINYRTGIWVWKEEYSFENRTAALANKNSFLRHPVADQNTCYVVRRYEHDHKDLSKTMDELR